MQYSDRINFDRFPSVADPGIFERGCGSGEGRGDYDKNTILWKKIARK